jgi:hypothetical protein
MCQYLPREKESPEENKNHNACTVPGERKAKESQAFADMISLTET